MPPSFFSKLVKTGGHNRDATRSPSPTSPTAGKHPIISISRPSTHRPSDSLTSQRGDTDNESINPNVTVIPPSPRTSDMSMSSTVSTPKSGRSIEDMNEGTKQKPSRRQHTLSLGNHPIPPVSPNEDDAVTPTPSRPNMSARETTVRPLSHSSSTGNLREQAGNDQPQHPRSATVATNFERQQQQDLRRTPSLQSNKSTKSNRSGLRIKLGRDKSEMPSQPKSAHHRAATSPANSTGTLDPTSEDGSLSMSPIVESPTKISPTNTLPDVGPSKHALSASATVPSIPQSSLLAAPDNSDTVSVYSVSSTTKKRKLFRRLSTKESTPVSPGLNSAGATGSSKSPKRKNTGLAGALAASGLAMANPMVSMPQISPAEIIARDERMSATVSTAASGGAHRSRTSIDRTRSSRSRQPSLSMSYPASEFSDRDSFVSGLDNGSDEDDDLDLDVDDIPVTGFAVASARRNLEFHEMFPAVPEGDYLIEGTSCCSYIYVPLCNRHGAAYASVVLLLTWLDQIMAAHCNARFLYKAACIYRRTTCASMPIYLGGSRT